MQPCCMQVYEVVEPIVTSTGHRYLQNRLGSHLYLHVPCPNFHLHLEFSIIIVGGSKLGRIGRKGPGLNVIQSLPKSSKLLAVDVDQWHNHVSANETNRSFAAVVLICVTLGYKAARFLFES